MGARIEIPTFEGSEVLKVPAGVQSGEIFRFKGKGIRDVGGHRKGDLYVKIVVKTPTDLTKEQKALSSSWPSFGGRSSTTWTEASRRRSGTYSIDGRRRDR